MGLQQGTAFLGGGQSGMNSQVNQGGMMMQMGPSVMLGPNGQPLVGSNGQPVLGPNGQPIQQQCSVQPILGPNGQPLIGPNGQPMLGPVQTGQQMGQFGAPVQQPFGNMQSGEFSYKVQRGIAFLNPMK